MRFRYRRLQPGYQGLTPVTRGLWVSNRGNAYFNKHQQDRVRWRITNAALAVNPVELRNAFLRTRFHLQRQR